MKTTTMELTPEALAALVNLVDLGVKMGGISMVKPAALVLPLLETAQLALNEQGNGAVPHAGAILDDSCPPTDAEHAKRIREMTVEKSSDGEAN